MRQGPDAPGAASRTGQAHWREAGSSALLSCVCTEPRKEPEWAQSRPALATSSLESRGGEVTAPDRGVLNPALYILTLRRNKQGKG